MSIIKILMFIWPFIKEMVMGNKSVADAAKDNKMKVLIAFILIGSIGMNMLTINRLWTMSQQYLELKKEYATYVEEHRKGTKAPAVSPSKPVTPPVVETVTPVPEVHIAKRIKKGPKKKSPDHEMVPEVVDTPDRYKKLREDFEKIKKREEKDSIYIPSN